MGTAYHEAGHALVVFNTPGADPLTRLSISPRGRTLGFTESTPDADEHSHTSTSLLARVDAALAGMAAETLVFGSGNATLGCTSDYSTASMEAGEVVRGFPLGNKLPLFHGRSEAFQARYDRRCDDVLKKSMARVNKLLQKNREK